MRYVIDIDGVIGTKTEFSMKEINERKREMFLEIMPNLKVIEKINRLWKEGNTIILYTSRLWHDYEVTVEWLKMHNVKYNVLIMAKPLGDVYVDDKCLSVEEFLK